MTKLSPKQVVSVVRNRPKNSRVLAVNLGSNRSVMFGAHVFAVGRIALAFPESRRHPIPEPPRNFPPTTAILAVPRRRLINRSTKDS